MIVCPVCEHAQAQGAECEVCGKKLLRGAAATPPVPAVEGLEPTSHAPADVGGALIPELEPTGHAAVDALPDTVPEVDSGRAAPVDVAGERMPELEPALGGVPDDAPTAVPALVTCRYCRTPSPYGERICGRCGMRLPTFEAVAPEEPAPLRRCTCGSMARGPLCPTCGARLT